MDLKQAQSDKLEELKTAFEKERERVAQSHKEFLENAEKEFQMEKTKYEA